MQLILEKLTVLFYDFCFISIPTYFMAGYASCLLLSMCLMYFALSFINTLNFFMFLSSF